MFVWVMSLYNLAQSQSFFLACLCGALAVKCYLLALLIPKGIQRTSAKLSWFLLLGILVGSLLGDFSWLLKLLHDLYMPGFPYTICVFCIRIAWAALIVQYQCLALFIESLTKKNYRLQAIQVVSLVLSAFFATYFILIALFKNSLIDEIDRRIAFFSSSGHSVEGFMMEFVSIYLLPAMIVPSLFFALRNIKREQLPKILKGQLTTLIKYLLCPFLVSECIFVIQLNVLHSDMYGKAVLSFSTLLLSYSMYHCIEKVLRLRFLNFNNQLMGTKKKLFITHFKEILDHLSKVTTLEELSQITQTCFKEFFYLYPKKTHLFIRESQLLKNKNSQYHELVEKTIEDFMNSHDDLMCQTILRKKILMYDELAFNDFYHESALNTTLLHFLEIIKADIFLPIYQNQKMIAYIVVSQNARNFLFTNSDLDEMIILANYIGTILHLFQNRSLENLMVHTHDLKHELYHKHQKIQYFKESIRHFLQIKNDASIGVIFYKKGYFTFGNQASWNILGFDPNEQPGHSLAKLLKEFAHEVITFKVPKNKLVVHNYKKIVISGMLNLEKNNVIITLNYAEIPDILKNEIDFLSDPDDWEYLLFLEATRAGSAINEYMPVRSETFTNFKVDFIRACLEKRPLLLQGDAEDIQDIVTIMHGLSLRNSLIQIDGRSLHEHRLYHSLVANESGNGPDGAQMSNMTIFVSNIDLVHDTIKDAMCQYLKTESCGFDNGMQPDRNIRIFACTQSQGVHTLLASHQLFSLYLKKILIVPSPAMLDEKSFGDIVDELCLVLKKDTSMCVLTENEKHKLFLLKPRSFRVLKKLLTDILATKQKKHSNTIQVASDGTIDTSYQEIEHAAQLGKRALKDKQLLTLLWQTFKNQNKIATFLGVNRSSVNRRCKEYNLQ